MRKDCSSRGTGHRDRVVDHRGFADRVAFDAALASIVDAHAADFVALAGFMRILGIDFVRRFAGRLVNIHPSLLPAFPGLYTHRRAIEAGCKAAGATVHYVTNDLDHGPIIAQAVVPVLPATAKKHSRRACSCASMRCIRCRCAG